MKQIIIQIPSPLKPLTLGILFYLIVFIVSPLTPLYTGTLYSWSYIVFSVLALYLGLILGFKNLSLKSRPILIKISPKAIKKLFFTILFIALSGVILKITDKYFLRGASLNLDITGNREALESQSSGILSIISAILYPFSFLVPFYYLFLKKVKKLSYLWLFLIIPISIFPVIDGVFFGSRSSALVLLSLLYFYFHIFNNKNKRSLIKNSLLFVFVIIIIFSVSGFMFSFRTESMGMDPVASTQISGYAHFVSLNQEWTDFLYSVKNSPIYFFYIGMINFVQYFIHGVFELLYLIDNFNVEKATFGGQNFFIFFKFFAQIFQFDISYIMNSQIRSGIYTTFLGPVYYDFGYFGILFNLVFSYLTGRIGFNILKKGRISLIPFYLYLLIILFFMSVVSLLVSAQGIYVLVAFLISNRISKKYFKKSRE